VGGRGNLDTLCVDSRGTPTDHCDMQRTSDTHACSARRSIGESLCLNAIFSVNARTRIRESPINISFSPAIVFQTPCI